MDKIMEELNVYLIRYHNNGYFCKSIVIADNYEEAEEILLKEYNEYGITIEIEEYEKLVDKGIVLTENTKL